MRDMWQVAKRRSSDGSSWWWADGGRPSGVRGLTKAWQLLAIVGLLIALAAACGDGGGSETEGSVTPAPTVEDGALAPCQALEALEAYRYTVELRLESPEPSDTPDEPQPTPTSTIVRSFDGDFLFEYTIETSFVAPDRFGACVESNLGYVQCLLGQPRLACRHWLAAVQIWPELVPAWLSLRNLADVMLWEGARDDRELPAWRALI